jgi:hypothetical protein
VDLLEVGHDWNKTGNENKFTEGVEMVCKSKERGRRWGNREDMRDREGSTPTFKADRMWTSTK